MGMEIRRALRALVRTPGSAATAVLVLAMGIGLGAFMFSAIFAIFGRGLGLPEEERLHVLEVVSQENRLRTGTPQTPLAAPLAAGIEGAEVAAFTVAPMNLVSPQGPVRLEVTHLAPDGFTWVSDAPVLGRLPGVADLGGSELPIVLGHRAWQRDFGGRDDIVGVRLTADGRPLTVVGVMREGYAFPQTSEAWIPLDPEAIPRGEVPGGRVTLLLRRAPGTTAEVLDQRLAALARAAREADGALPADLEYETVTLIENNTGTAMFMTMLAMAAAVGLVLLVACANVANLLLARASERSAEVGIRAALGGGRVRVVLPFLVEALILAGLGALLGLVAVYAGMEWMDRAITTEGVGKPYFIEFVVDLPVVLFTVVLAVGTAVLAGIGPAIKASRTAPRAVLAEGGRGSGLRMSGLMKGLVVAEVALSATVLIGAGVTTRSLVELSRVDLGFVPDSILVARIDLVGESLADPTERVSLVNRLHARLVADPALANATLTRTLPGTEAIDPRLEVEGVVYRDEFAMPRGSIMRTTAGFFDVIGGGIVEGRDFEEADLLAGADPVVLIDEPLAAQLFPGGGAIGRRVRMPEGWFGLEGWFRIVGIVPDATPQGLESGAEPGGLYFPLTTGSPDLVYLMVRTPGRSAEQLLPALRAAVAEVDPTLPLTGTEALSRSIDRGIWFYRVFGSLFTWFGAAALVMAALGLFAVLSFSVTRRRAELGIRIALGAETGQVLSLVSRQSALLVAVGLVLGLGLGWLAAGAIEILSFRTSPRDPLIYLLVAVAIFGVAVVATLQPLRRATRIPPVEALRR